MQDQTNLLKKKCSKYIRQKSRYNLIKYSKSPFINSSNNHFGYPLSNKDLTSIKEPFRETLEKNFINNLVDMENKEVLNEILKKIKKPTEYYHSFEFFKYHSFIGHTRKNFPFLFYGESRFTKNKTLINKYFKENGYITSLAHDASLRDNTICEHEYTIEEVYDYEFNLCDPNKEHININTIRCLYGKQDLEHLFDYTVIF